MAPVLCSNSSEINIGQVEDIQELWRSRPATVPERDVRDRDERPVSPHSPFVELEVPVNDMSKLIWGNPCEVRTEMAKHTAACQEWGFFQIMACLERIEEVAMDFFMLPLQEKEKYPMVPGTLQGGHAFIFSEDQKLDWCNMLALGVEPPFIRNHKLWPTNPSNFSETLETYSSSIRILCQRLLALIAKKPWTETNCVQRYVRGGSSGSEDELLPTLLQARSRIGIESTFGWQRADCLEQDTRSIGLQIFKDSIWLPVKPVPNALVINIGDTLEVLTNGRYKSDEHRVVTNK